MGGFITTMILIPEMEKCIEMFKEKIRDILGQKLEWIDYGRKHLAYDVRNNEDGYYIEVKYFATSFEEVNKLEAILRASNEVLKYMTVKEI